MLFFIILLFLATLILKNDLKKATEAYDLGNKKKALAMFKVLCKKGNAQGCYNLALMYEEESIKSKSEILDLFMLSCKKGYSQGCYSVGKKIFNKNKKESGKYFFKACNIGDKESCFLLGNIYYKNNNKNDAFKMYKKACKERYSKACRLLGDMYYKDDITMLKSKSDHEFKIEHMYNSVEIKKENNKKALIYYRKACANKDYIGCYKAGLISLEYPKLEQTKKDIKRYFKKACYMKYEKACKELEKLH